MEKLKDSEILLQKLELLTSQLICNYKNIAQQRALDYNPNSIFGESYNSLNINSDTKNLVKEFSQIFGDLFTQSQKDFYYWDYCPFKVYEAYYVKRKELFLNQYLDATEIDFINKELLDLDNNLRIISWDFKPQNYDIYLKKESPLHYFIFKIDKMGRLVINDLISEITLQNIEFSHNRKIDFIKDKLNSLSNNKTEKESQFNEEQIFLDYSDNKIPERIVFMHELGIIEYLRNKTPFNTSTNKLAEVLSAFTGIKQTTIQSYINPIFSKDVDKSKSPLNEKNLKNVTEKLMKMGYNLKENHKKQSN